MNAAIRDLMAPRARQPFTAPPGWWTLKSLIAAGKLSPSQARRRELEAVDAGTWERREVCGGYVYRPANRPPNG